MEYIGRIALVVFFVRWAYLKFSAANPELATDLKKRAGEKARGLVEKALK